MFWQNWQRSNNQRQIAIIAIFKTKFYMKFSKFFNIFNIAKTHFVRRMAIGNQFIKSKNYNSAIKNFKHNTIVFTQSVENKITNRKILINNIKNIIKSNRRAIRTVEKRITKDFRKRKAFCHQ